MKRINLKFKVGLLVTVILLSAQSYVYAVDNVPAVDLNRRPTDSSKPYGAFKLLQCDGPAKLNSISTHMVKDTDGAWVVEKINGVEWQPDPKFIPCDFKGLMIQIQFLINAAMFVGVLAAVIGFAYAGFLFMTGTQENIKKAKGIFPKIFWGFVIMLVAWAVVYQILAWLTPSGSAYMSL